jgi:hypothetical protein
MAQDQLEKALLEGIQISMESVGKVVSNHPTT